MRRQRDMSVTDKQFSEFFDNSLEVLAIVQNLAARAQVSSLAWLCEQHPDIVRRYCDTARLALHALKKLERARKRRP